MFDSNDAGAFPRPLLRPVSLQKVDGRWLASPADEESGPAFLPFYIPLPPRCLMDWLVVAGHRFWQQRQRCMAALLLVDCSTGHWTLRLPHQRCGAERAVWSLSIDEFAELPSSFRLGGVFQTICGAPPRQDCLPAEDGFHFILSVTSQTPMVAFVRHSGGIEFTEPIQIVANDWGRSIDAAMPRLRFA